MTNARCFHQGARFRDRREAGRALSTALADLKGRGDVLVLALPRGGVPVGYEISRALGAPLDVFVVRKLGVPGHEELAMGAIAPDGVRVFNEEVLRGYGLEIRDIAPVELVERAELERRMALYRGRRPGLDLAHQTVVLVDDGLATGACMRAAVLAARTQGASSVIVAAPVASRAASTGLADRIECLLQPEPFGGVALWYEDFAQVGDDEVRALLDDDDHIATKRIRRSLPSGSAARS